MAKKYPMTQAGKEKLEGELTYLKEVIRKELEQRIKDASSFCDVSEDVSFKDMINEQGAVEERIESLKDMLYKATPITEGENKSSAVKIGSTVTFAEFPDGEEETYTIVGIADADPAERKISSDSPIAEGLFGHVENDVVSIHVPGGGMEVEIIRVR